MSTIDSITSLLSQANTEFLIFDIGREINQLEPVLFEKVEQNQLAHPYPSQGHAHLALVFRQSPAQPFIWFVKLPLDERGLLNLGARNHFIAIILEALGNQLTGNVSNKQQEILNANPYHFTPPQYKLATLNALISYQFKLPASQYYDAVTQYFSIISNLDEWQHLAVQGIADYAVRATKQNQVHSLVNTLPHMPKPVLTILLSVFEHLELPEALAVSLLALLEQRPELLTEVLRALASSNTHESVRKAIVQRLSQTAVTAELLIVIASRHYNLLSDGSIVKRYLEHLAKIATHDNQLFAVIFKDLVSIPTVRPLIFDCMRDPKRSPQLSAQIGLLFQ
jgi:hypothetical protein